MDEVDFFEKMFGFSILLFEHNWRETNALQQHLDSVMNDTKQQLLWLLERVPKSISDLWRIWLDVRRQQFEVMVRSSTESQNGDAMTMFSPIASNVASRKSPKHFTNVDEHSIEFGIGDEDDAVDPVSPILYKPEPVISRLLSPSSIFTPSMLAELEKALPMSSQGNDWALLYSIAEHGASLHTLLTLVKRRSPTMMVIQTACGCIFGGYASDGWHHDAHYYGTGESFVFSATDEVQVFKWSRKNSYFMLCNDTSIGMGGGGSFGFLLVGAISSDIRRHLTISRTPSYK